MIEYLLMKEQVYIVSEIARAIAEMTFHQYCNDYNLSPFPSRFL